MSCGQVQGTTSEEPSSSSLTLSSVSSHAPFTGFERFGQQPGIQEGEHVVFESSGTDDDKDPHSSILELYGGAGSEPVAVAVGPACARDRRRPRPGEASRSRESIVRQAASSSSRPRLAGVEDGEGDGDSAVEEGAEEEEDEEEDEEECVEDAADTVGKGKKGARGDLSHLTNAQLAELIARMPVNENGETSSVGSLAHLAGNCRPCATFARGACSEGILCHRCHFLHGAKPSAAKRPSKNKRNQYRILVDQFMTRIDEDPFSFDLESLEIPKFIEVNGRLKAKFLARMVRHAELVRAAAASPAEAVPRTGEAGSRPPPQRGSFSPKSPRMRMSL